MSCGAFVQQMQNINEKLKNINSQLKQTSDPIRRQQLSNQFQTLQSQYQSVRTQFLAHRAAHQQQQQGLTYVPGQTLEQRYPGIQNQTVETRWSERAFYQAGIDAQTPSRRETGTDVAANGLEVARQVAEYLKKLSGGN